MELSEQQQLFGALLGFRVGDRVKTRRKVYGWKKGEYHYYWEYGKVVGHTKQPNYGYPANCGQEKVKVSFQGFVYLMDASDLVRCRKYVKRK